MPYVAGDKLKRDLLLGLRKPSTPGELNFMITSHIVDYLGETPRYANINEAVGVLECAKLEAYRRIAEPYEDIACATNGDVYYPDNGVIRD